MPVASAFCLAIALIVGVDRHAALAGKPATTHPRQLTRVVVATGFIPDVLYAPYYVAQDLGYYRAEGLDVTMNYDRIPDLLQEVGSGKYDFAVASGDAVVAARAAGVPVTYVMAQYERYPIGAMALKSGPALRRPSDLRGKTIGISGPGSPTYIGLRALLRAGHLSEHEVRETNIGFTETEALIQHRIDIAMTFVDNEPVQARALGYPVTVLPVSRYLRMISNGIVTSTRNTQYRPELVQRFVTATLRGLRTTLRHPNLAFRISMRRMPEIVDPAKIAIQRQVLAARLQFEQPPKGHPLGWSSPRGWRTTVSFLRSIGVIQKRISVSSVDTTIFTNRFAARARA